MSYRQNVNFKRTDGMEALVRELVVDYHKDQNLSIDKRIARRRTKELLVAIESGVRQISLKKVKAKD